MDESELLRRAVEEPAEHDELAMQRARARLRVAIQAEGSERRAGGGSRPGRHRSRVWWAVAAAALAITALVVQTLLPIGGGGPPGSAAEELRRLGSLAATRPPVRVPPGSFLYTAVEERLREGRSDLSGNSYSIVVRQITETWAAGDGSGRRLTTTNSVGFVSAADEAAWRAAGSPSLPRAGATSDRRFGRGEVPLYRVSSLPTDPDNLLAAINGGKVIAPPEGDASLLLTIGILLAQPNTSPDLRRALFEVAARIPSMTLQTGAVDPLGRPGVRFTVNSGNAVTSVTVDPRTSTLLAREELAPDGSILDWQAFVRQGTVTSITARPVAGSRP